MNQKKMYALISHYDTYFKQDDQETAVCLQVVLLNRAETDRLVEIGPELFSNFLYPDDGDRHFICERKRRDKF